MLGIKMKNGGYVGAPGGEDKIHAGDVITMYGKAEVFKNLDAREDDFLGDWSHKKIVEQENPEKESGS